MPPAAVGHVQRAAAGALARVAPGFLDAMYDNSTLTLTSVATPDPFVTRRNGIYYFTFTAGNRVEIWRSHSLADIETSGTRHVIWTPPPDTDYSADLWAPELHALQGRWYVYVACASAALGNRSHRMYVLGGPGEDEDPCLGGSGISNRRDVVDDDDDVVDATGRGSPPPAPSAARWEFLGRVGGLPESQWAIDATAFRIGGTLYMAYSGWPPEEQQQQQAGDDDGNPSDLEQRLYLVRMENPTRAAVSADDDSGGGGKPWAPTQISMPEHAWETTLDEEGRGHGINEGPQFLASPDCGEDGDGGGDGSWRGLVYSCAGSWTHEYKMAALQYVGGGQWDPLDARSWRKAEAPLIMAQDAGLGPWGPGHGCFVHVGEGGGGEVVAVYHATDEQGDGWANRRARVRRVAFTPDGPFMGHGRRGGDGDRVGILARLGRKVTAAARPGSGGTEALRALIGGPGR